MDINKWSLHDQCLIEVIQEQGEKAHQATPANGKSEDEVTVTVTKEMVEAKTQEKRRKAH